LKNPAQTNLDIVP